MSISSPDLLIGAGLCLRSLLLPWCAAALRITFVLLLGASALFSQGALTPPGAPAATMKTLDQIQPRTPIKQASLPFTINAAGSYYVAENLTVASGNAITINAKGVTLDLMGFTISSTANPAAGSGIVINNLLESITILNGNILGAVQFTGSSYVGAGFQNGLNVSSASIAPRNVRISGVSVKGCTLNGIYLGNILQTSATVDHCLVRTVGSAGIQAGSVTDCVVSECGGPAINCLIASNSSGDSNSSLTGIAAKTALNCVGASSTGTGLSAESATGCRGECRGGTGTGLDATEATSCIGQSSSGIGLHAANASNCSGTSSSGPGVYATTAANCNGISSSDIGLQTDLTASNCTGRSTSNTGLAAYVAIGCYGFGTPPIVYNFHYNMPPNNYPTP
jgi:hypothetical protein